MSLALTVSAAITLAQGAANLLPSPRGASGVGRVTFHWVDSSRAERFAPDPGARREVLIDVWYPASRDSTRPVAPYLPGLELVRRALGDSAARRRYAPAYAAVEAGRLQSHAIEGAPARCGRGGCPVLLFSHGGGVDRSLYSAQYEDYASHGYVVAAIAHPYLTHTLAFSDGRVVRIAARPRDSVPADTTLRVWQRQMASTKAWADLRAGIGAADLRFVIDQLTELNRNASLGAPFAGQLNLERVGALGHSMGGRVAATACQVDRRIKVCLDQDGVSGGVPFSRDAQGHTMQQPFMYLGRREPTPPPLSDSMRAALQMTAVQDDSLLRVLPLQHTALLADIPAGAWRVRLTVRDVVHMSFSDELLIQAGDDSSKRNPALLASRVIQDYTRAFFEKTLLGGRNTLLDRAPDTSFVVLERFAGTGASRQP